MIVLRRQRPSPAKRCRPGFTIIETLVVIGVMTFLAGLFAPSLRLSVESARRTKCLANLRTLGIGLRLYMDQESRGVLPAVPSMLTRDPRWREIFNLLAAHLDTPAPVQVDGEWKTGDPWTCPSDHFVKQAIGVSYYYGVGMWMAGKPFYDFDPSLAPLVTAQWEQPDSHHHGQGKPVISEVEWEAHQALARPGYAGSNVLRMDGSVGWSEIPLLPKYLNNHLSLPRLPR
jgi:type II secretory pathway pseudopilin PulG